MTDERSKDGPAKDEEENRLAARAARYVKVGTNVGGVAAKVASQRLLGLGADQSRNAADLAAALGGLKGPIMKVAQLLSTIPDALPREYASELSQLQSQAPPMGPGFVKRRMKAELGPDWQNRFRAFDIASTASASLGQVHRATLHDGREVAVKLQYPDMQSAVEADLTQLKVLLALHKRIDGAIDSQQIAEEISERLREELDYEREAKHIRLYRAIFRGDAVIQVPEVLAELSTRRLLTMSWLSGTPVLHYKAHDEPERNDIAAAMFRAWWYPFSHYGVIHGDPHLGNYTVFEANGRPAGINLLDYGCIRLFPVPFVGGVLDLYHGLFDNDEPRIVHAYETWGFTGLDREVIEVLNIWARFIFGPLLDDRVRRIAEDVSPSEYGRKEFIAVHSALKRMGPLMVPREFVFMDRAAIGLGGVFLHLAARHNWYRMFNDTIEGFTLDDVRERQRAALLAVDLPNPLPASQ